MSGNSDYQKPSDSAREDIEEVLLDLWEIYSVDGGSLFDFWCFSSVCTAVALGQQWNDSRIYHHPGSSIPLEDSENYDSFEDFLQVVGADEADTTNRISPMWQNVERFTKEYGSEWFTQIFSDLVTSMDGN